MDLRLSGEVEGISELVLVRLKGGYEEEDCSIPSHFAQNLQEKQYGWEGIVESWCPRRISAFL